MNTNQTALGWSDPIDLRLRPGQPVSYRPGPTRDGFEDGCQKPIGVFERSGIGPAAPRSGPPLRALPGPPAVYHRQSHEYPLLVEPRSPDCRSRVHTPDRRRGRPQGAQS
jgi:hypothetical protein